MPLSTELGKIVNFRRILKKVRRTSKDLARDIERKLRRSPVHPIILQVKSLFRSKVSLAPAIELGLDGKLVLSIDQLCLLAGEHLRQQGLSLQSGWERGWSITPIIENDAGERLTNGECFLGLEFSPYQAG